MTQCEKLLTLFHDNNNKVTLGLLLQYNIGYRAVQRMYDLRKKGYDVRLTHQDHEHPTNNVYELKAAPEYKTEPGGQMAFV